MNVKTKRNQQKCKDDKKTDECDVDRCKKLAVNARLKNRLYNRFKHWSYEIPCTVRLKLVWPARREILTRRSTRPISIWVGTQSFYALANAPSLITHAGHISLTCSTRIYRISSSNSRGDYFFFRLKGGDYSREAIISNTAHWKILFCLYPIK